MIEIPLFPLKSVLFPGMPIALHIFEDRYKEMIQYCIDNQQPFGVVLIKEGDEALGPLAQPHPIGCTAQITQVERLDDGRMNILAIGLERFRIEGLSYDHPYLVGTVELIPFDPLDLGHLDRAGHALRPWVVQYLSALSSFSEEIEFDANHLPNDPVALAYLAAAVVQIPDAQKQTLLAAAEPNALLTDIRSIYRREVALLNEMRRQDELIGSGMFSLN